MLSKMILLTAVFFRIAAPIADELASAFVAHDSQEAMPYLTHYGICAIFNDPTWVDEIRPTTKFQRT